MSDDQRRRMCQSFKLCTKTGPGIKKNSNAACNCDIIGHLPITTPAVHNGYWRLFYIAQTVADKVVTEFKCKLGNNIGYTLPKKGSLN